MEGKGCNCTHLVSSAQVLCHRVGSIDFQEPKTCNKTCASMGQYGVKSLHSHFHIFVHKTKRMRCSALPETLQAESDGELF